jgi:hypothetical protein
MGKFLKIKKTLAQFGLEGTTAFEMMKQIDRPKLWPRRAMVSPNDTNHIREFFEFIEVKAHSEPSSPTPRAVPYGQLELI